MRFCLALSLALTACAGARGPAIPSLPPSTSEPAPDEPEAARPPAFTNEEWERVALQQPWVDQAADEHALPPNLINGVIWVESRFNPKAKSPAGARGLMQLMPATASALAQKMGKFRAAPFNPEFNIAAGSLYLRKMLDKYDGDVRLALAAYNAGAGNVNKWLKGGGLPPASEEYVELVLSAQRRFDAWDRPTTMPETMIAAVEPQPDTPPPEKLDIVPDPPVRYDLDRVESNYVPTPAPEPPLADTPLPPVDKPKPPPKVFLDEEINPPPEGLPSVLD